jgi:hypothetical protein
MDYFDTPNKNIFLFRAAFDLVLNAVEWKDKQFATKTLLCLILPIVRLIPKLYTLIILLLNFCRAFIVNLGDMLERWSNTTFKLEIFPNAAIFFYALGSKY